MGGATPPPPLIAAGVPRPAPPGPDARDPERPERPEYTGSNAGDAWNAARTPGTPAFVGMYKNSLKINSSKYLQNCDLGIDILPRMW